jgi:hypothetical protein
MGGKAANVSVGLFVTSSSTALSRGGRSDEFSTYHPVLPEKINDRDSMMTRIMTFMPILHSNKHAR